MMLNILAITADYPPLHGGGYGLQMNCFCEGLSRRGHTVHVLTTGAEGQAPIKEGVLPVDRALLGISDQGSITQLVLRIRNNITAVRQSIRSVAPDVVLCGAFDRIGFDTYQTVLQSNRASLTWLGDTWLAQAWHNLPVYDRWHGIASGGRAGGIKRITRRCVGRIGRIVGLFDEAHPVVSAPVATLSQFVLDHLRQSGAPVPADAKVIPVSLHPAFFGPDGAPLGHGGLRTPELRALFVGRMELLKGPDTAIRGVANAVAAGANIQLTFAGLKQGEMRPQLEELATSLGIADRITWAGTPVLSELIALYRNNDVFLFPSRIVEGLGVVNCEALACGLPIIGTAHSGSAEVIIPGESGFRIEKDDHEAMGRYLAQFHFERNLLDQFSTNAPKTIQRFAPNNVLDILESELYRVLKNHPKP